MISKVEKIHNNSIKVLEKVGIKLCSGTIIEKLKHNGIKTDGQIAYFTEKQVMECVSKAPSQFELKARNSDYNMLIGGENREFSPGYGCTKIVEADGGVRDGKLDDYIKFLKLTESSNHFNINGGILIQPENISAEKSHLILVDKILNYSEKSILGIPGDKETTKQVMDLLKIVFGEKDLIKNHRVLTLISTVSPLMIDEAALGTMEACIENNQPLILTPGPISGGTGPITLAANLTLGNAELLATICVSQILKEGTPVIYGLLPTTSNVINGSVSIGSPGFALQSKYSAELARFYDLPNRSGGTESDAKGVCVQSGYEAMLNMFSTFQNKSNFVIHSAGILDAFGAMSYEKFICDLEIISSLEYYFEDIKVDKDDLGFDVIKEVGHGGEYLSNPHTFMKCRTEPWFKKIGINESLENNKNFNKLINNNIKNEISKLVNEYKKPELGKSIQESLTKYINNN